MSVLAQSPNLIASSEGTVKSVNVGNDIYYFRIIDSAGTNIQQLWKLDANTSNASKVKTFGSLFMPYGEVGIATEVNNKLYFKIYISPGDDQLWVSDGTEAGTQPLMIASKIYAFFNFNNELYFSAHNYTNAAKNGVYKSNGTVAGTVLLKNIQSRYNGTMVTEGIANYTSFNNKLVFTVHKGVINNPTTHYAELWATDGTAGGFVRLDSMYGSIGVYGRRLPYPDYSNKLPEYNNMLYFSFVNKATNNTSEIWRTNASPNGSAYFHDLGISANSSPIVSFNYKLIFTAFTSNFGQELYTTDGTIPGTSLLKDINSSPAFLSSNPYNFLEHCNKLFFIARDSSTSYERMWETDGTNAGTKVHRPERALYSLITKLSDGNLYYAYRSSVNFIDSIRIYKIDNNCNSTEVVKWAVTDYGNVSEILYTNSLCLRLDGGIISGAGLYRTGPASSINPTEKENIFTFYPNPANNQINFNTEIDKVVITNMLGEIVYNNSGKITELNLSNLAEGLYVVSMSRDGEVVNQKMLKQ